MLNIRRNFRRKKNIIVQNNLFPLESTIVNDRGPKPLTVDCDGQYVYLREHIKVMRLGVTSTRWLHDALGSVLHAQDSKKITLNRDGEVWLTLLREMKYLLILGRNTRYNFETDTGEKMYNALAEVLK